MIVMKMKWMEMMMQHDYLLKNVLGEASLKPQASMLLIVSVWAMMVVVEMPHYMFVVDGMLMFVDIYSMN